MPDIVEKLMKYLPTVFKEMTNNLKLMGYEDEDIDPITLHMI